MTSDDDEWMKKRSGRGYLGGLNLPGQLKKDGGRYRRRRGRPVKHDLGRGDAAGFQLREVLEEEGVGEHGRLENDHPDPERTTKTSPAGIGKVDHGQYPQREEDESAPDHVEIVGDRQIVRGGHQEEAGSAETNQSDPIASRFIPAANDEPRVPETHHAGNHHLNQKHTG